MYRLIIIFAGVVATISGCNGLLSTQFGTQRLQRVTAAEVEEGVGDRDYLEVRHLLTRVDDLALRSDSRQKVVVSRLGYAEDTTTAAIMLLWRYGNEQPFDGDPHPWIGMVEQPPDLAEIRELYNRLGYRLGDGKLTYLHVGQSPLSGWTHALIMAAGLSLAIGVEYRYTRRRNRTEPN